MEAFMIRLNRGDKIAIVSLSNGILGEKFCSHQLDLGVQRLKEMGLEVVFMENTLKGMEYLSKNPKKRAEDLINAFKNEEIKGILCAIGGDDTYRLAPYILNDEASEIIKNNPKFFMGYSDSTINHLMLYKLGLNTFYGLSFLTCFAELGKDMLKYSKKSFENIFTDNDFEYSPSEFWFEERENFSTEEIGKDRVSHKENRGYELLQGKEVFSGKLIGGCIESLYDLLVGERYSDEKIINEKYNIFPSLCAFENGILFLETSEEKISPKKLEMVLNVFKEKGIFEKIEGIIFAKPQNEVFYEEYKEVLTKVVDCDIPILYNLNFGHSYPKMILQYGALARVNSKEQKITISRV